MNAIAMLIACGRHQQGTVPVDEVLAEALREAEERVREAHDSPRVALPSDRGIAGAYALPSVEARVEEPESVALVHDNPVIR